jgi:type I restriction enzyme S subunit
MSFFLPDDRQDHELDPFYRHIRDDPKRIDARNFVEARWKQYAPYAEPSFLSEARKHFHERTWEMYLACVFLRHELKIQKKSSAEGPDIQLLNQGRTIWVEAIAPTSGTGQDAVPPLENGKAQDTPKDQIILRLTAAIKEKFDQYKKYRKKNIIGDKDCFVIAVNGGHVRSALPDPPPPYIVSSVFPFGDPVVTMDKKSMELIDCSFDYRDTITKRSGAPVPTNVFENEEYSGISAVLYSWFNVVNRPTQMGAEIEYVHNPLATKNRLPRGFFRFGREWWVESEELCGKKWKNIC